MSAPVEIVIIEDEVDILAPLQFCFEEEGFVVHSAEDGIQGLNLVRRQVPNLIILDLMLPRMDGLSLCEEVRSDIRTRDIPVIMLTAKDSQMQVINGLSRGADDYVTKPFSTRELIARARAVLKRGRFLDSEDTLLRVGPLALSEGEQVALLNGEDVRLTPTEFKLIYFLALNSGNAFTRNELLDQVFGEDAYVIDRNIDVHIRAIRKKLDWPELILTLRGYGYRLELPTGENE
ncbi:MAG: response regulator transcription factor [Verrucomicrobiota bacterium]